MANPNQRNTVPIAEPRTLSCIDLAWQLWGNKAYYQRGLKDNSVISLLGNLSICNVLGDKAVMEFLPRVH
jgi:hypothetical protein